MRKERKKFSAKKIFSGIWYAAVILLAIVVAVILSAKFRGKVPKVMGYSISQTIEHGERIAQLILTPVVTAEFFETDTLSDTARGEKGFGSTGLK